MVGSRGVVQEAARGLCGPDISCMVVINTLRSPAIWAGHGVSQTFRPRRRQPALPTAQRPSVEVATGLTIHYLVLVYSHGRPRME